MEDERVRAFRALRPLCVEASRMALELMANHVSIQEYVKSLERLHDKLRSLSEHNNALDPKLAEYAFVPLSHVFREAKVFPVRVVEIALGCLNILIVKGWRDQMVPKMVTQLMILLPFLAGGSPSEPNIKKVNEELATAAFECLIGLFQVSGKIDESLRETESAPVLGYAVTVMLDGVKESPSPRVRLAAIASLNGLIDRLSDHDVLKGFFPGIVSSITQILSAKNQVGSSSKLLVLGLETLQNILGKALSDDSVGLKGADQKIQDPTTSKINEHGQNSWLEATASQVKMALANVVQLRYHERLAVGTALSKMCVHILVSCRNSMHQSISMIVDTVVVLYANPDIKGSNQHDIISAFSADTTLLDMLKSSLHDWVTSLPRIVQSNDDTRKQQTMETISAAYMILQSNGVTLDLVNDALASNLKDSVSALIERSAGKTIQSVPDTVEDMSLAMRSSKGTERPKTFQTILFGQSSGKETLAHLEDLTKRLLEVPDSSELRANAIRTLRTSAGHQQLAVMWLCLQMAAVSTSDSEELSKYFDLSALESPQTQFFDGLYSFAMSILSRSTFDSDSSTWQLQALSLESLAHQALVQQRDFRPELVDSLYPVLERLGSSNASLQQHAMTCLNIVSNACGYTSPSALIVDNADYLVNAISMKLNTFDISPQAPQVLVMMVRLCGSPLIPYLDDLVESVFSILACYHGYPKLVESLFSVLKAIVEEAGKSSTPLIEGGKDTTTRPKPYRPATMDDVADLFRKNRERRDRPPSPLSPPSSPPHRPFAELAASTSKPEKPTPTTDKEDKEEATTAASDEQDLSTLPPADPPAPRPSKTHNIITSITSLTPSHLTSPSPTLRTSLLSLLTTSLPPLSHDTDSFLPLAASLYPYISTRLFSPSALPFETRAAAQAMATLLHCAGDFMKSRTDAEWPRFRKLFHRVEREMQEEVRASGGKRVGGNWWRAWDAVVGCVVGVVRDVGVGEEGEDGVFEILGGYVGGAEEEQWGGDEKGGGKRDDGKGGGGIVVRGKRVGREVMSQERREEVEQCLEDLNPDFLWLVKERGRVQRGGERLRKPVGVAGLEFRDIDY